MISPGEKFNPFSDHRMTQKTGGETFEIGRRYVITPSKHHCFTLIHLINRTVTNTPWVFWLKILLQILQLASISFSPYNENVWNVLTNGKPVARVLSIIVRYVPHGSPKAVEISIFVVAALLSFIFIGMFPLIMHFIKLKKEVTVLVQIYFFYGCLFLPIVQTCFTSLFASQSMVFFIEMSFPNFFLSLFAFIALVVHITNCGWVSFCLASGPHPNLNNPMAVWAPTAGRPTHFDIYLNVTTAMLEFTKNLSIFNYAIFLCVYFLIAQIPSLIYHFIVEYLISFSAYELMVSSFTCTNVFCLFISILCFIKYNIPQWALVIVWIFILPVTFIIIRLIVESQVHRYLLRIDEGGSHSENDDDFLAPDEPHVYGSFEGIPIKSPNDAVKYARIACVYSHPAFLDLSFVSYLVNSYPEATLEFLHLSYLIPDQTNFVQSLIDRFLDNFKPNFLQEAILFQIVTGIQESSSELTPTLLREISVQNLQGMKCQQLLSKVWSSCYKGDITQMSRHAFLLNKLVQNLNKRWTYLALRYPFSIPVLKEYVRFLNSTGCQHKRAEAITAINPKLNDNNLVGVYSDININLLKQSIEESTDRRPIVSTRKLSLALLISIILAIILLCGATAWSIVIILQSNNHINFITHAGTVHELMAHTPNLYDSLRLGVLTDRQIIYDATKELSSAYNNVLKTLNKAQMESQQNEQNQRDNYFKLDDFDYTRKSTLINLVSKFVYYQHALTYVPANDPLFELVEKNEESAVHMVMDTAQERLSENDAMTQSINRYSSVYFVGMWIFFVIVIIVVIFVLIKQLKEEMVYLFSLYLTIPRSTISKFMELTGSAQKESAKNAFSTMMTSSFVHVTRTITDIEEEEKKPEMLAENFKVLVNDSPANQSVLPRHFQLKASLVLIIMTGIPIALATVTLVYFLNRLSEIQKYAWTLEVISERTTTAALLLHGITEFTEGGDGYGDGIMKHQLKKLTDLHSSLLFSSGLYKVSQEMFNSDEFQSEHFDPSCEGNEPKCQSIIVLFDDFVNVATNVTESATKGPIADLELIRFKFNDALFPKMQKLLTDMQNFANTRIKRDLFVIGIIIAVCFIALILVYVVLVSGVIRDLTATISSVKLPLKFIDPLDLADQTKLVQYLQGECDYGSSKVTDQQQASSGGASFLNVMTSPFAIFENDFSLLFANNAFYSLLGTSREATVGLPMMEIFSPVFPFKSEEDHPFNALIEHAHQLYRGVAAQRFTEIVTSMAHKGKTLPVMVRLVGVCENEGTEEIKARDQNLKASQFMVFITDLSARRNVEEKLKYESEITAKLLDSAVPRALMNSLRKQETLQARFFESKPMVTFTLATTSNDEDVDDDMIVSCALLMRTMHDINTTFTSVTKIIHEPPSWVYIGGISQSDNDIKFYTSELILFAISVVEVFQESVANQTVTISAAIHIGSIALIPLELDLPAIEPGGEGYRTLRRFARAGQKGKVIATAETEPIASVLKDVFVRPLPEKFDGEQVFELIRDKENDDNSIFNI